MLAHARRGEDCAGEREVAAERFAAALARRTAREPLAYILGRREFWSLTFAVSRVTLIPRPESETLIEAALAACPEPGAARRVLDLGTGTGCLLLAALAEFPAAFGVGIDCVAQAAPLAAENAESLGLAGRAAFAMGDWAESIEGQFDLVLTNPPYIERAAIAGLAPEIAHYEPRAALDGGADGLDAYRQILPDMPRLLTSHGVAIVEIGFGAASSVAELAVSAGLSVRGMRADLAGVPRAIVLGLGAAKKRLAAGGKAASLRPAAGNAPKWPAPKATAGTSRALRQGGVAQARTGRCKDSKVEARISAASGRGQA